jgi:glucose/arabinose dehydrogenase
MPAAGLARVVGLAALVLAAAGCPNVAANRPVNLASVRLPPGFRIDVYAADVPGARSLALGSRGTVFVGTRDGGGGGRVYALVDSDGDQRADRTVIVAAGLTSPNGVAFRDGALYVAEIARVLRYDGIEAAVAAAATPPAPVVINDSFPRDFLHGWKYLRFGPDGWLYIPLGTPCNVCRPDDPRFGTILRMHPDGSGLEIFAAGIRNTVGFDFHPDTGELWFTENGHDSMGDREPPDELDHAPRAGMHFGFPFCHGHVEDPNISGPGCDQFTPPEIDLEPHAAALGMVFYTGRMFPAEYRNRVFIAEHGSAHRSRLVGYRLSMVRIEQGKAVAYEPFAEGFLEGSKSWARPVDVLVMPDGALLFSDDRSGAVYRISYAAAPTARSTGG